VPLFVVGNALKRAEIDTQFGERRTAAAMSYRCVCEHHYDAWGLINESNKFG
jgi:hypothetical protein